MLPLRRRAGIGLGAGSFTLPKVSILHICRAWIVPSTSDAMQGRAVDRLYAPGLHRPVTLAQCECGIFTWYRRRNRASNDDRFWPRLCKNSKNVGPEKIPRLLEAPGSTIGTRGMVRRPQIFVDIRVFTQPRPLAARCDWVTDFQIAAGPEREVRPTLKLPVPSGKVRPEAVDESQLKAAVYQASIHTPD